MARTIKLSISARGEGHAPTVDDLLDQVRDYFEILNGVEEAVAEDSSRAIEWRVVDASKVNPITIEAAAMAREFAVNVDQRAEAVLGYTADGLEMLQTDHARPPYFTDKVLARAEKLFARVTNGLDGTKIEYGKGLPVLALTPMNARIALQNAQTALRPASKPYQELGAIEGFTNKLELDGHNRPLLWVKHRISHKSVKCILSGDALAVVQEHRAGDILETSRVRVAGTISYKALGEIREIHAIKVEFLRTRDELPGVDDILDPDFTNGIRSEEYLDKLRNGKLS